MATLPYMQLYIADYLADTMHLSAEEHGAYLLLMFNYWQTGRAIPKSRLAKIARISSERWGAVEESLREFFIDNGTEWIHERIENDLAAVRDVLAKKSAAGKASVQSRRNRKKTQAASGSNTCSKGVGSVFKQEANKKGTNKDIDLKELNPTHNACARASAPVSQPGIMQQPAVTEPEYREGLNEPIGKFSMMDDWHPSLDFRQRAAQWGVALPEPEYLPTELVAFRDYWTSEGKVFTQIQWEQKFARHVNHVRAKAKPASRGESHAEIQPDSIASRAVQQIRAARVQWERENGIVSDGDGLATLGSHGGNLFEPMDAEERRGTFEAVGGPDWGDD
ncbi:DUF1376 domain-containing protein [Salmonella enterica subsp. enterica serovar Bovismorbificans]|uniref:DUF1376 domain-containing protein n=3 Tax=Salmonella enterica I TaxID=59201 RepID=A0A0T7RUQ2_SALET|nr:DUF1376 domain-containing protein [Salmonella enterica]EAB5613770.1 DUF1376 domain-containing protein [Salmonella enterica subsp. enterica serovar Coeln]EBY8206823.1 DUF1376 domain-containing protein [Salmonella enterica subsp. enterica serovar Eastbourne]ECE9647967.1 DUF1376 domain-containing protein [Salmonella enterica subsp. enterica serovar Durban]ECR2244829.1 DUF1376 domain-containing protein [Salmonella enterica subsp. enterica]ECU7771403.1 DUF1376 domain-containing protein [Salmonel